MKLSLLYTPNSLAPLINQPALLLYIFTFIPVTGLCDMSLASKYLNILCSHPILWSLDNFELKNWISESEYAFLETLHEKERWRWCFEKFVFGQFIIGLSRNSRVRVPETCILCKKVIKPLVLRWERKRVVRDEKFVANGAELKNDQELLYFHWSCVEPPTRFNTHFEVPGYSSLTFEAKQTVREFFDKRKKSSEKQLRKGKENAPFAVVCDSCDKLCGETTFQCMPNDDCHLCMRCYRMKTTSLRNEHSMHGNFEKFNFKQHFNCNNCKKSIKDFFYFCKDCPNGLYLCTNCFRRSRSKNHDENHQFYAIGNSENSKTEEVAIHPSAKHLYIEDKHEEESETKNSKKFEFSEESNVNLKLEGNSPNSSSSNQSTPQLDTNSNSINKQHDGEENIAVNDFKDVPSTSSTLLQSQSDSGSITDSPRKRKRTDKYIAPAKKRPKKLRLFDELINKRLREDFALRHFKDLGVDINELTSSEPYLF